MPSVGYGRKLSKKRTQVQMEREMVREATMNPKITELKRVHHKYKPQCISDLEKFLKVTQSVNNPGPD